VAGISWARDLTALTQTSSCIMEKSKVSTVNASTWPGHFKDKHSGRKRGQKKERGTAKTISDNWQ